MAAADAQTTTLIVTQASARPAAETYTSETAFLLQRLSVALHCKFGKDRSGGC